MGKGRRANHEGTLEKLKDGRYRVRLTIETPDGKRRKAFTAKTQKAVIQKRDAYLRGAGGMVFDAGEMSVSSYLDRWMEDSVTQSRRPSTVVEYESVCRVHLKPTIGTLKLRDLRAVHIQRLLSERVRDGYAPGTARRIYAILGAALRQAVKWQVIPASPMAGVDAPRIPGRTTKMSLSIEQARHLFQAARGWREGRLYAICLLAVTTGMRQGEILGLEWSDIDFERHTLTVRRTLHRERGGFRYGPTKGGKPRTLDVDERLASVLGEQRRVQKEDQLRAENWSSEGEGLVFRTLEGKPVHRAVLLQSFQRLCKREELPAITFHELRHTCATIMAERGQHPQAVQAILGHADVKTTLTQYTHAWPGMTKQASTALADVLFSGF